LIANRNRIAKRKLARTRAERLPTKRVSTAPDHWLVWQLIDSAFPTGGFAHSSGLEAAWQHGEIPHREAMMSFVEVSLHQLGRAALPYVAEAYDSPGRLVEFDSHCDVFLTNHVANRASRAQGRAFLAAAKRVFSVGLEKQKSEVLFAHFAPVFGACLRHLEIDRKTVLRMFLFNHLRSLFAAAVRLNIIGPMEAQIMQRRSSSLAEKILEENKVLTLDAIAQTSPLLEIWQGAQDRLYSRLFQS
jgi:urease accessory protein